MRKQVMATLGFKVTIDGLDDDTLVVRQYQGQESISDSIDALGNACSGFRYSIDLASRLTNLTAEQMVDKSALLEVVRNGEIVQRVHGIVRRFSKGDTGHTHTFYSITLVPALERLSLRYNSRIFQQQTVSEIISILLQEMNITDYSFAIKRKQLKREFCVQYRETDLQFLHRIAAEEGMVYSFIHQSDKHIVLFTDSSESLPALGAEVPYNVLSGGAVETTYVSDFTQWRQSAVSRVALQDYSFKQPAYHFSQAETATNIDYQLDSYEHFDAPGRFKDDASGKAFNHIRLNYLRRHAHTATGKSNDATLQAGAKFDLIDHLDESMNRDWLLVQVSHQGTQPQALEESGGSGQTSYTNQFMAIPADQTWQATPQTKPQVDGPCIATVVGPKGEEIFCDEYGRVKLTFPWDRYSTGDEKSSCWVRVSQGWAGAQYGMVAIPRIGHEVIVSFLDGDPDQPIITGRTYHANNVAPYPLPANKTKTVIRSESHQGSGFNELSFEDQAGSEMVYLHGQKDYQALIEHDQTVDVKHDHHVTVENDRYSHIKANDHLTVSGEQRHKVAQTQSLTIDGALHIKTGQVWVNDAGTEIHIKAGQKVTIEAGTEITVKAGSSFVKVDPSGVSLSGPGVNLNSGGSAGSGSGFGGAVAALPGELADVTQIAEAQVTKVTAQLVTTEADVVLQTKKFNYVFSA
jgi:type VI secretion system secreted protein VgrG